MNRPLRRLAAPLALAATFGAAISCSAIAEPGTVAALDFTGIPFPAIVTGDSMRDTLGVATPITATAYNGRGDVITSIPITYFSLDTGVVIHPDGHIVASRRDGTIRLLASAGGLQSQQRIVQVTRLPDSVVAPTTTTINYSYAIPDRAANVSPALTFTLRTSDTTGGLSENVEGWLVRWRVIYDGDTLGPTDTTKVALWDVGGTRHSLRDTTNSSGASSRRLRVYANNLLPQPDSFIVVGEVRVRGALVLGSPVRFVVNIAPPGP